jgi:hypothetical protein
MDEIMQIDILLIVQENFDVDEIDDMGKLQM